MPHHTRALFFNLLVALIFSIGISTSGQTSSNLDMDSANSVRLKEYNVRVQEIEKQRSIDSAKKSKIEEELGSLKRNDTKKKQVLEANLDEIELKELLRQKVKQRQFDSLRLSAKGYPVTGFLNDTLFIIYYQIGSFSAKDRAEAISKRIETVAKSLILDADSFKIMPTEIGLDIVHDDLIMMSIQEADALWNNTTKTALADDYKLQIEKAIRDYRTATSTITIAKEVGMVTFVLLVLFVFIYLINRFFIFTRKKIIGQKNKKLKSIHIKSYQLLDTGQLIKFVLSINVALKWFVTLAVVYLSLPVLFSIFPWTKGYATTLLSYFTDPFFKIIFAVWEYVPNLITIFVIVVVFKQVIRLFRFLKTEVEIGELKLPGFYPDWATPTFQIIKILLYAFMFIVIFPFLPGSNSPVFQGVSVFLGVLFTFGSSGSLNNIVAGLIITYMRSFKIGDRVKIGDITGDIIEKSLLVTRIRTIKNEIISIPNSNVMSANTINYSSDAPDNGLILHTTVTIGYDVPWKNIHQALIDAAIRTEFLLDEPKPFVLQTSLDDFYVSYQLNAYTREPNKQAIIYSNLHQNIQDCCNEAGIEILSPHYRAARDGNMTTIPSQYLPSNYEVPSFNVNFKSKI